MRYYVGAKEAIFMKTVTDNFTLPGLVDTHVGGGQKSIPGGFLRYDADCSGGGASSD